MKKALTKSAEFEKSKKKKERLAKTITKNEINVNQNKKEFRRVLL